MGLPWPFRKKVTEAEGASQLGCVDSGNKLQRQKEVPWRQVQGFAQDKLPLPTVPLVTSLLGTFRAWEKASQDTRLRKEVGGGKQGVGVLEREHARSFLKCDDQVYLIF